MYTYGEIFTILSEKMLLISVLILVVVFARFLLGKAPKIFSYLLWFPVLFRILYPMGDGAEGIFSLLPEEAGRAVVGVAENMAERPVQWAGEKIIGTGELPQTEKWTLFFDVLLMIYLLGVVALVLYAVICLVSARYKLRDAIRIRDNIYQTERVENSLVCGIFRPRIYVNPCFTEEELVYILAHERNHIRRRDYIVKPVAFIIFSIVWINPVVWLAYILMMRDMEISCDESALKNMDMEERKAYSHLLLHSVTKNNRKFWQTPSLGGKVLKKRIYHILHVKKITAITVVVVICATLLCGVGAFSSPRQNSLQSKEIIVYDR